MTIQYQNVGDTVKPVLRGNFIALNVSLRDETQYQFNYLSFNVKKLEK